MANPQTGKRKISNVVVNLGSKRIFQLPENDQHILNGNKYSISVSDSYFFTETTTVKVKKNESLVFEQIFENGLPKSYRSFHENGAKFIVYSCENCLPHGLYQAFYDNGQLMVSCFFENGVLQGDFTKYEEDGKIKYKAPFVDGNLEGVVSGNGQALYYKNRKLQQLIKLDENGEIIKWKSGDNSSEKTTKLTKTNVDKVRYTLDNETGEYTEFFYGMGDYHFRYANYPTRNMMIINLHKDKNNWFSLYVDENNRIKDDINVTVKGKNYRQEFRKTKLKLIEKHFLQLKKLRFPHPIFRKKSIIGDTVIYSSFYPNGVKCLKEKFVKGKYTGTRKTWSFNGGLLQVSNYLGNHNEGLYVNFSPEGEVIEKGNYVAGIKNGSWTKLDRSILYEFIHDQSNTATKIKTYYPSGNLKSIYTVLDSGKISEDFDEKGNRIKLNIRNFKGKLHGEYKTTYKGKTYIGYYLNGYKHGVFETYDEKGNLEATQNYEFGRIVKNPNREERKAVCKCSQEFNIINGSRYFPAMNDFISYNDFGLYFKDLLTIPEKEYDRLFVRGFQNSYSRNNVSRFYGFDMNGGRFALQHPLLKNNDKPSSIYFNFKSLQVEDRIVFK